MGTAAYGTYIYTDGDLSVKGIQTAYPKIVKNMEFLQNITMDALQPDNLKTTANLVGNSVVEALTAAWKAIEEVTGDLTPYTIVIKDSLTDTWTYIVKQSNIAYEWIKDNLDWNYIWETILSVWKFLQEQWLVVCEELKKNEAVASAMETTKGYASDFGVLAQGAFNSTVTHLSTFITYIQNEGPKFIENQVKQISLALENLKN